MGPYTEQFYEDIREGSRRSAREIVPIVLDLVSPKNVIDVGCGLGTWLSVFKEFGVDDIWGAEGNWVDKAVLEIPKERFLQADLTKPFRLERKFDLVVSVEVAEHLSPEFAGIFLESLVRLGPVVLFSAAIPFQGGKNHVNEQWQGYWAEQFQNKGYHAIDCIRKRIWQNARVEFWYAQNMLMFARLDYLQTHPALQREYENTYASQLSLVHPRRYLEAIDWMRRWVDDAQSSAQELAVLIPPADTFILVDQGELGNLAGFGRGTIPFLEHNGEYWGPPPDDATAVREFERLRRLGASYIVFVRPAFWWLDYYCGFTSHLRSNFRCVLENERIVAFDLRLTSQTRLTCERSVEGSGNEREA
jgi:SAM-dependent methyltransferase